MLKNVQFNAVGKFTSRGEWIHPCATVPTTEIIIVTEGCVKIEEQGVRYTLTPGSVLFLAPNVQHSGFEISRDRVSFYWIHMHSFDASSPDVPEKQFTLREPHNASILCRQLIHYSTAGAGNEVTDRILYLLLYELTMQSKTDKGDDSALVRRIREWIRINCDRNITAPIVAREFGYNEDYISRLCKHYYGYGLKSMITDLKVGYIKKLLLETEKTLAQISDATGFSDYKLFLKFFKYHADMTPSEYRHIYYAIKTNNR